MRRFGAAANCDIKLYPLRAIRDRLWRFVIAELLLVAPAIGVLNREGQRTTHELRR